MGGGISIPDPNEPDVGLAGDLVAGRFGLSSDLVSQYDSASSSAFDALAAGDFSIPMENLDLAADELDPPPIGEAPIPDAVEPYESQAQEVAFPDLEALKATLGLVEATIEQVTLPVLSAQSPSVSIPDAPDDTLPEIPDDVPSVTDPSLPAPPGFDLPAVPVLDEVTLPNVPAIDNLTFEGVLPTADLTPPEPMFIYDEATYQSDLADALKTKLYNDVTLGGTGLSEEVEQAIWDRALSRINIELDKVHSQVLTNWETWNYEMPDGILSGALQEVAFEDVRTKLDANRDILIKQAELAQENTHFAITSGMVFEKQIMDYTNQVNQRAFEVARFRVQAVIDIFNIRVNAFNARMDGYKALAQVFESRIRAELSKVEVYRAQMEGAKIHGDLQAQKIAIYTQRVQALQTLIDLYRAQMEGARLQVDVDKAKIDAFRSRLDAVVAQIGGVTAKYNLYQAQIAGETSKVDLYGKQVNAFATQVDAVKVESDINIAETQAVIDSNKDKISLLIAAVDKYKADTQYELGKDETGARVYSAKIDGYGAEVGREAEYLRAKVDAYRAEVTEVMSRAELIIKEMDVKLRAAAAMKEIQMEALKAAASVQAQKVASALSSVSASAQIGFNGSISDAYSRSVAVADQYVTSDSNDFGIRHNYNYNMT